MVGGWGALKSRRRGGLRWARLAVCPFVLAFVLGAPAPAPAAWHEVVGGIRPISDIGHAPSLASIDGVPYVAWREVHGPSSLVFVARLNAAGTQWEKVGGPVNADLHAAEGPSLTSVGGVPNVAWGSEDPAASTCARTRSACPPRSR